MNLFGIGSLEVLFVIVLALLVLGPSRMADVARDMGRYVREFRRATSEIPRLVSLDDEPSLPPSASSEIGNSESDGDNERSSKV